MCSVLWVPVHHSAGESIEATDTVRGSCLIPYGVAQWAAFSSGACPGNRKVRGNRMSAGLGVPVDEPVDELIATSDTIRNAEFIGLRPSEETLWSTEGIVLFPDFSAHFKRARPIRPTVINGGKRLYSRSCLRGLFFSFLDARIWARVLLPDAFFLRLAALSFSHWACAYLPSGSVFQRCAAFWPPLRPIVARGFAFAAGGFSWSARTAVGLAFGLGDVPAHSPCHGLAVAQGRHLAVTASPAVYLSDVVSVPQQTILHTSKVSEIDAQIGSKYSFAL